MALVRVLLWWLRRAGQACYTSSDTCLPHCDVARADTAGSAAAAAAAAAAWTSRRPPGERHGAVGQCQGRAWVDQAHLSGTLRVPGQREAVGLQRQSAARQADVRFVAERHHSAPVGKEQQQERGVHGSNLVRHRFAAREGGGGGGGHMRVREA